MGVICVFEESINNQFVEAFDDNFEEIYEDIRYNYNLFRKRNMEAGPAAGRTLYELGEEIQEYPGLLMFAYITLTDIICKNDKENKGLINHQIDLLNSIVKDNRRMILTTYNNLNEDNKDIFLKMLLNINENAEKNSDFVNVETFIPFK